MPSRPKNGKISEKTWIKAQAEYRAGATMAKLCRDHDMSMSTLIKRMREENWSRPGDEKKKNSNGKAVSAAIQEQTDSINSKVDEAIDEALADIIQGHRSISRTLRDELDEEIAEYQALKQYFVSSLDKDLIEELMQMSIEGEPNVKLIEHLNNCMAAFGKRTASLDKLIRLGQLIVDVERKVWSIDKESETGQAETYDDLLETCKKPLAPRALPEGIVDFESKLAERRGT